MSIPDLILNLIVVPEVKSLLNPFVMDILLAVALNVGVARLLKFSNPVTVLRVVALALIYEGKVICRPLPLLI